ncbi:MAG: hypothetical protein QN120_05370 [Armatimonadota bacterium]|nr:hypothetical protein [Armatimonadota bacterium]
MTAVGSPLHKEVIGEPAGDAISQDERRRLICRMPSGWAVLHDWQYLPGCSLLVPEPAVRDFHTLSLDQRLVFLRDMALLGEAVLAVTGAATINYSILDVAQRLQACVCPRYDWEPRDRRWGPFDCYDMREGQRFDPVLHARLATTLASYLERLLLKF